ncbi:MAG: S-layer homology domain-containing protein, partial [Oscillospiraceae bacterium]|nr:S-layer homology domain-containing protein [Oscillospiraceae bacterium]
RCEQTPIETVPGTAFTDVPANEWYTDAVAWASANGIVNGVGGNRFAPDDFITRQDLAAIIMRYAEHSSKQFPVTLQYQSFADEAGIAEYAKSAVRALYCGGIVNGKPGKLFDPAGTATRAEAAALLRRFIEAGK